MHGPLLSKLIIHANTLADVTIHYFSWSEGETAKKEHKRKNITQDVSDVHIFNLKKKN